MQLKSKLQSSLPLNMFALQFALNKDTSGFIPPQIKLNLSLVFFSFFYCRRDVALLLCNLQVNKKSVAKQ